VFFSFFFNEALAQVGGFIQFQKQLTDCSLFGLRVIYYESP